MFNIPVFSYPASKPIYGTQKKRELYEFTTEDTEFFSLFP